MTWMTDALWRGGTYALAAIEWLYATALGAVLMFPRSTLVLIVILAVLAVL